jgi:putative transposase
MRAAFGLDVRVRSEVTRIERESRTVEVRRVDTGETYTEGYDKLVLSPGANPVRPPIPGVNLPGIYTLRNVTLAFLKRLSKRQAALWRCRRALSNPGTPYIFLLPRRGAEWYGRGMARLARVVMPGVAHHITQRGNRRLQTFFDDDDDEAYLALMAEWCDRLGVAVWAYCLMPNHVHLIAVPGSEDGLRRAVGEAHRRYTRRINFREGWRGHLWQGRFASFPMDDLWLLRAARYVELNPVRAKLCRAPWRWRWSSAAAHVGGKDDVLVRAGPLLKRAGMDWRDFLLEPLGDAQAARIRSHESTGRPLGSERFVVRLEKALGRVLRRLPAGRPRKEQSGA